MKLLVALAVVILGTTVQAISIVPSNPCWDQAICAIWCPWGNQIDENGCMMCACKPPPFDITPIGKRQIAGCPPVCAIFCPWGNQLDVNGCPTCSCNPAPLGKRQVSDCPPVCDIWCQYGNQLDVNGCPTCACNPAPIGKRSQCPPVMCMMFCENGFQLDHTTGCPICSCNTEPQTQCQKELSESYNQPLIGAFRPTCAQDGSYASMQCHASTGYCWCVSSDGERISDQSRQLYSCDCIRHRYEETNKHLIGNYIPQCELDGSYSSLQCHGSTGMCWCSDKDGNKLSTPQHGTTHC